MGAPILTRQRITGLALETVQGAAQALTAANFATPVRSSKITDATPYEKREMQASFALLPGTSGAQSGKAELMTELFGGGAGATPPPWAPLLKACGFAETIGTNNVTYALQTGIFNTATIAKFDGASGVGGANPTAARQRLLYGAMGTFKLAAKAGQIATLDWSFDGVYADVNSPTLPADILFATTLPPTVMGITLTIGGQNYVIPAIELDLGNKVEMRENVTPAWGYYTAVTVDQELVFKVSPEALAYATKNWSSIFRAGTTAQLSLVIGTAAGNTITIAAPALQIGKAPDDQDEKNVLHDQIEFLPVVTNSIPDSQLTIVTS